MSPLFRDDRIQAEFNANGYVKLPWLEEEEVKRLRALHAGVAFEVKDGFSFSQASQDADLRRAIRSGIEDVFGPRLRTTFVDVAPLMCSFFTKTKGDGKTEYVPQHQDWTFVDESNGDVSVNIWCPLEDTHERNGNLRLVPMSNRLPRFPRPAETRADPYRSRIYHEVLGQAAVAVPTRLGDAILFDSSVVHSSSRNQTDSHRLVAAAVVVPRSAPPVLYYQNLDDPSLLDEYESGPDYFTLKPFGVRPDAFLRSFPRPPMPDLEDEIRRLYPHIELKTGR